ncbi:MAG: type 2 lanthipeptide synthetase LanM family protein, partial [Planctomycetota bacterium]
KLVYKPRCLQLDEQFQALLAWTNERGFELPFQQLRTLTRPQYGWVEFVEAADCQNDSEAANFFRRQGAFLGLLHAIGGSDIHHENIIARGEHPVLVDLEVLFSPENEIDSQQITTDAKAAEALATSVVRTGMLPYKVWQAGASEGVDVSGLVDVEGATTPDSVPVWDGQGSDDMQLTRRQVSMEGSDNLPRLHGKRLDVRDHQSELLAGFESMYRLLATHRDELLSEDGPFSAFAALDTRVVLRMSRSYGKLQNESFHPDALRDALDRDVVFDRLWSVVRHQPKMKNLIASEREQLWQGDIPAFTVRANSTDLCTISGELVAEEYFAQSGLSAAEQRIANFGEDDLAAQKWFIEASLATSEVKRRDWQVSSQASNPAAQPNDDTKFVERAIEMGEKLEHLAIHHGKEATWNGLLYAGRKSPIVSPLALDLYEGIPGVAWFLAHLGSVTNEKRFTRLAEKSLNTILGASDRLESEMSPGGFYGLGGVIYTLTHLGSLWQRADLIERATKLAHRIPECSAKDQVLDLIAGSTGGLASILTLHSVTRDPALEEIASRCGERLLATATNQAYGRAWQLDDLGPVPIVGASHGTAGAAWALHRIASITEREDFSKLGKAALAYERSQYDASRKNWPNNMHAEEDAPEFTRWRVQWCHGAPGIGLLRAKMLEQEFDATIADEVRVAAETTLRAGFGFGHCLCHGDVGNLECLMMMADALQDDDLRARAKLQAGQVFDSIEEHGPD